MTGSGDEEEVSQMETVVAVVTRSRVGVVGWKEAVWTTEEVEMERSSLGSKEEEEGDGRVQILN